MLTSAVLNNPSPYTLSMRMGIPRDQATVMHRSTETVVRDYFGTRYTYDGTERTLTIQVGGVEL